MLGTVKWLIVTALFFGVGCGPVKVLRRDPAFRPSLLAAGGIALGGITRLDTADYYAEESVAGVLSEHLKEGFPGMRILPLPQVKSILGPANWVALKEGFYEGSTLSPSALGHAAQLSEQVDYLLLVNILEEEAPDFGGVRGERLHEAIVHPRTHETFLFDRGTRYTAVRGSYRRIRAHLVIFDLSEKRAVWFAEGGTSEAFMNAEREMHFIPRLSPTGAPGPSDLFEVLGEEMVRKLK